MSCFVMKPESIKTIACTMEDIFNDFNVFFGAFDFAFSKIKEANNDIFKMKYGVYVLNKNELYNALMKLNLKAYNGRYWRWCGEEYPLFSEVDSGSIHECFEVCDNRYVVGEWLYHLAKLLDCYLYQTAEDGTDKDDFRLALVEFNKAVKEYIVVHSTTYNKFEWGV